MTSHRHNRTLVPAAALLVILFVLGTASLRADVPVELTRVGNPIWRPTDFHLFTAPADTDEAFFAVADAVLGPAVGPPRQPPYDDLLSGNMAAAGIQDATQFLPSHIGGAPFGIYHAYALVPDPGETGSSFQFASGPIIPNRLYPLVFDHDLLRNGVVVDPEVFDGEDSTAPGFDGQSHTLFLLEENASYFPNVTVLTGDWQFRAVLRDAEGNGWNISVPFTVVPEPAGAVPVAIALALLARRRSSGRAHGLLI